MAVATRSAIDQRYRRVSGWLDGVPESLDPRDPLPGDAQADVAIAGGGLTGLWTAYCLAKADPRLRIVVCERDIVGYGASGRNGGFQSAGMAGEARVFGRTGGMDAVRRAERAFMDGIDWVGAAVAEEGIDCGWHKGGALRITTSPTQAVASRPVSPAAASAASPRTTSGRSRSTSCNSACASTAPSRPRTPRTARASTRPA